MVVAYSIKGKAEQWGLRKDGQQGTPGSRCFQVYHLWGTPVPTVFSSAHVADQCRNSWGKEPAWLSLIHAWPLEEEEQGILTWGPRERVSDEEAWVQWSTVSIHSHWLGVITTMSFTYTYWLSPLERGGSPKENWDILAETEGTNPLLYTHLYCETDMHHSEENIDKIFTLKPIYLLFQKEEYFKLFVHTRAFHEILMNSGSSRQIYFLPHHQIKIEIKQSTGCLPDQDFGIHPYPRTF